MKHYVMMTNEDFNALPTATTQIYFPQHGNEDCKRYFLDKDFSFNKLIPVPNYLYTMPGNLVEKALATYFTDYGLSSEPLSDFQIDVLKELGIDVPEKQNCTVTINKSMVTSVKEISVTFIGEHLLMY